MIPSSEQRAVSSTKTAEKRIQRTVFVFVCLLPTILLISGSLAEAQQAKKVPRIGFMIGTSPSTIPDRIEGFRQGLRDLGYVEGKNVVIEYRVAEGKVERLPNLLAELVRLKVDVIVTGGIVNHAAKQATTTIPIVIAFDGDPVGNGLVASLARPGGNITGLSALSPELSGKRLELLKETVPRLSRVVVIGESNNPGNSEVLREMELAAKAFGVKLQSLDVRDLKDIETAFRAASKARANAVIVLAGTIVLVHRAQITTLAIKSRLPAMYPIPEFVEDGGLMTYGPSIADLYRRAATYVDKILKGAKPADLPVEQPMKFEFVINLKTAKQIGLTVPPNVLARADRVIR
jgi:putative tryptophan/tyrosine transport system substrate-binding protein